MQGHKFKMAYRYNLVLQDRNWVMESIANNMVDFNSNVSIGDAIYDTNVINFYLNWHAFKEKTYNDVCLFTHLEDGQEKYWSDQMERCDVCVSVGTKYLSYLPAKKTAIFYIPPSETYCSNGGYSYHPRTLNLLVVGRPYNSGRKNTDLILDIRKEYGNLVDVKFTGGDKSYSQVKAMYNACDYVLVTSTIESGPMCVPEAMAMHKPVIAPDVGWCWDYPVIKYKDKSDLFKILNQMLFPKTKIYQTYETLFKRIESILNER